MCSDAVLWLCTVAASLYVFQQTNSPGYHVFAPVCDPYRENAWLCDKELPTIPFPDQLSRLCALSENNEFCDQLRSDLLCISLRDADGEALYRPPLSEFAQIVGKACKNSRKYLVRRALLHLSWITRDLPPWEYTRVKLAIPLLATETGTPGVACDPACIEQELAREDDIIFSYCSPSLCSTN